MGGSEKKAFEKRFRAEGRVQRAAWTVKQTFPGGICSGGPCTCLSLWTELVGASLASRVAVLMLLASPNHGRLIFDLIINPKCLKSQSEIYARYTFDRFTTGTKIKR